MSEPLQDQIRSATPDQITVDTALSRGIFTVAPEKGLRSRLLKGPARLYLGIDPTSPNLHLGHTVPLRKLQQFVVLGHEVILLFGTFTGRIGDPTDKSAARVQLSPKKVENNMATYAEQASRVLDIERVEIVQNHEWLDELTFEQAIDLAARFTVQQMLSHGTFRDRMDSGQPLHVHELLYPLMQGYDAVMLDVDLQVGGSDQLFNMITSGKLVQHYRHHTQWSLATKLIEDPSGQKMSKTEGIAVGITKSGEVIFEAIMAWSDTMIPLGLELITDVPQELVTLAFEALADGSVHPMELKQALAHRAVAELHGEDEASLAETIFGEVKRQGLPLRDDRMEKTTVSTTRLSDILVACGLASDTSQAKSLLAQTAVRINYEPHNKDVDLPDGEYIISLGKKSIANIRHVTVET